MCSLKVYIVVTFFQLSYGDDTQFKIREAFDHANTIYVMYIDLFRQCLTTSMPNERFIADNLHNYINAFSKTTVGYASVYTDNRKFFANMINTADFKTILEKDVIVLQNNIVEKIKFCDDSVMDQETLKLMYDREVDQTKQ